MRTFETYTKEEFITAFNLSKWSNWNERMVFPDEFDRTGKDTFPSVGLLPVFAMKTMGLEFVKGYRSIDADYMRTFKELIDIPNYEEVVAKFNKHNVMQVYNNQRYILKDNFNLFREEIGLPTLSNHYFGKLAYSTSMELVKNQVMFQRLKNKVVKNK